MPLTLEQTTAEALALGEKERAHLARILIASLEPEKGDFADEWEAEIARRVDEIDNGTARGRPAADVLREIRARYE